MLQKVFLLLNLVLRCFQTCITTYLACGWLVKQILSGSENLNCNFYLFVICKMDLRWIH